MREESEPKLIANAQARTLRSLLNGYAVRVLAAARIKEQASSLELRAKAEFNQKSVCANPGVNSQFRQSSR